MHKLVNPDHIVELCHAGESRVELNASAMPLPSVAADADVPDWVHLLPTGQVRAKDGRGPWHIDDAAALVTASMKGGAGLVIDVNHSTDRLATQGKEAPAVGWIVELQSRADGIWGKVEWTASGRAKVAARDYRFISPVFKRGLKDLKITQILRASLVNNPNLLGLTELNSEADMNLLDKLIAKLGLKDGTGEDALVAAVSGLVELNAALPTLAEAAGLTGEATITELNDAVGKLKTAAEAQAEADPGAAAKDATITELNDALTATITELKDFKAAIGKKDAEAFVDGAIASGVIGVKSNRDFYIEQHMANPATAEKMIGGLPKLQAGSSTRIQAPKSEKDATELNEAQSSVATMLGLEPADMLKTVKAEGGQIELN